MKTPLLLSLLLLLVAPQNSTPTQSDSSVSVLGFRCSKARQVLEKLEAPEVTPAREVIAANKNYPRNARVNDPQGAIDPNADTIDGRSAAIDQIERQARSVPGKVVDGFAYLAKIQNKSDKVIDIIFWEYQFVDRSNPANVTRRQFLCGVNVKPNKTFDLKAFTLSGPRDVVSVGSLAHDPDTVFQESAMINRVEFADGTKWQRKDWNFAEIRLTYKRATGTPWGTEMCRAL